MFNKSGIPSNAITRIILSLLIFTTMLSTYVFAEDIKIGTIINKVLSTDIKTYVNGYQIPSMNIDGSTAVVVENLRKYGFDVVWNPQKRTLTITTHIDKEITPISVGHDNNEIGNKIADVIHTDIKTYINGKEVPSFNINGYTAIQMKSLSDLGTITWNKELREVHFVSNDTSTNVDANNQNLLFNIEYVSEEEMLIKIMDDKIINNKEEIGFIDRSNNGYKVMISSKAIAERFKYDMSKKDSNGYIFERNGYSFEISNNNNSIKKYYYGKLIDSGIGMQYNPISKNNDLYIYDCDLPRLFGLTNYYDKETNTITLKYKNYSIEDHGNYKIEGEKILIKVPHYFVRIDVVDDSGRYQANYTSDSVAANEPRKAYIDIKNQDYTFDLVIYKDNRILLLKEFNNIKPYNKPCH